MKEQERRRMCSRVSAKCGEKRKREQKERKDSIEK